MVTLRGMVVESDQDIGEGGARGGGGGHLGGPRSCTGAAPRGATLRALSDRSSGDPSGLRGEGWEDASRDTQGSSQRPRQSTRQSIRTSASESEDEGPARPVPEVPTAASALRPSRLSHRTFGKSRSRARQTRRWARIPARRSVCEAGSEGKRAAAREARVARPG